MTLGDSRVAFAVDFVRDSDAGEVEASVVGLDRLKVGPGPMEGPQEGLKRVVRP